MTTSSRAVRGLLIGLALASGACLAVGLAQQHHRATGSFPLYQDVPDGKVTVIGLPDPSPWFWAAGTLGTILLIVGSVALIGTYRASSSRAHTSTGIKSL